LWVELGIAQVTLSKWRRQALIDAGQRPGLKSYDADPLAAGPPAHQRSQSELKVVKAASALFEEGAPDPRASTHGGRVPCSFSEG